MTQGDLYIYTTSDFTKKHAIVSRPASDAIFCNIDYSCPQSISDSFLRIVYIQFSENILRCVMMVYTLRKRSAAISLVLLPNASERSISFSVAVS